MDKQSITTFTGSLTGFEELAISGRFGADFADLPPTRVMRALAFVHQRRALSGDDQAAYNAAMGLTVAEVQALWAPEEIEGEA